MKMRAGRCSGRTNPSQQISSSYFLSGIYQDLTQVPIERGAPIVMLHGNELTISGIDTGKDHSAIHYNPHMTALGRCQVDPTVVPDNLAV